MELHFLQANINHSARAQDLLYQSMAEWSIDVAVVAEPYFVPATENWAGDLDGLVAIGTQTATGSPDLRGVERGHGFVAARLADVLVVGAYFSPNRSLAEFELLLGEVGALIDHNRPVRVLFAGDLNAKSMAWGCPATSARGHALEEWSVSTGLVVANRGSVETCVRQQGGSIVDITFTDATLASRLQGWKVLEDAETLSDHRYIRYSVSAIPTILRDPSRRAVEEGPRWTLTRLDRELLIEAAIVEDWVAGSNGPAVPSDVEREAEHLSEAMSRVCDAAMPRAGPRPALRSVYWWSADIAQLRATCVAGRRQYHRCRRWRRRDANEAARRYALYREAVRSLRVAIGLAKREANERELDSLNGDPWGKPYKRVRGRLRQWAPPLTQRLEPTLVDRVVASLFPSVGTVEPPRSVPLGVAFENALPVSEGELGGAVRRMRAKDTAPGPDGIPGRAWALALGPLEARVRAFFSACLRQGQFPSRFKTGKLVLLKKEGRPADSPSAFRPIVLLDELGKLFERIVASRLVRQLEETGPDLSAFQFGFRRGRSTLDAIARVRALADEAVSHGEVVLAVSLDIANAFNTMPWNCILDALVFHGVPEYLRQTIGRYLSERSVRYPTREGEWCRRRVSCGVPQGSVLGPTLWNVGYDSVLRGANLRGVGVTCYADDTLVTARGSTFREARVLATAGVSQVVARIRRLGLEVALNKSEAVCFHGPRMAPQAGSTIVVGGTTIPVRASMRYLGLVLDSRWKFEEHFRLLAPKLVRAAGALSRLLPNLGGPNAGCRRLYTGVVRSMALYGAPIWASSLTTCNRTLLRQPQRVMAIRVIRGYRTISCEAACILAGTPPWDLEAESLARAYWRRMDVRSRGEHPPSVGEVHRKVRREVLRGWERRVEASESGRSTVEALGPILRSWMEREHGVLSFRLVQVLSGHGCFGSYLHRRAGRPDEACNVCVCLSDTALHTLSECPFWARQRATLVAAVGPDLSLADVVRSMLSSESSWNAVSDFCEDVMSQKREAERSREAEEAVARPRRTAARRRFAEDRRLPP